MTRQLGPRGTRIVTRIGWAFIVLAGLALAIFGSDLEHRVAGITLILAIVAVVGAIRGPDQDVGALQRTDHGVRVPRRLSYPAWMAAALLFLSVSMLCMGAAAIKDPDYRAGYRGSAEALVVLFPPLFLAGLGFVVGPLFRRGSLELTPEHVRFTPVVGRRKTCTWSTIAIIEAKPKDALVVAGAGTKIVVGHHTQRWTLESMEALVRWFAGTDDEGRAALVAEVSA